MELIDEFDEDGDGELSFAERREAIAARREILAERRAEAILMFDIDESGDLDDSERAELREYLKTLVRGES